MHARRIPRALAGIGHGERNGDFVTRLQHARRSTVQRERQTIRRARNALTSDEQNGCGKSAEEQEPAGEGIAESSNRAAQTIRFASRGMGAHTRPPAVNRR
jgi:hypothetical protein